jgi:hypothetical protein
VSALHAKLSQVETIRVKILDPKAKRLLVDLEELNLIEIDRKENGPKVQRRFGAMKGFVTNMADDFDAPLEDFKDYT